MLSAFSLPAARLIIALVVCLSAFLVNALVLDAGPQSVLLHATLDVSAPITDPTSVLGASTSLADEYVAAQIDARSGWDPGVEAAIGSIHLGAGDASGSFTASGAIDQLVIHDAALGPPSPKATRTPDPAQPTSTRLPTHTRLRSGGNTDASAVLTPAPLPLRPYNVPFTDPAFGTTVRRITNVGGNGPGTHIYSQLQAFSPDNAYIMLIEGDTYVIRRLDNLTRVNLDTAEWNAPRWQPSLPHSLVYYDSNADTTVRVRYTDVGTRQTSTIYTFPAPYQRIRGNQSFDELSRNGRWMGGMATAGVADQALFALDLQSGALGAQLSLADLYAGPCAPDPQWGEVEPDWVGVSPLGNYLIVQWARDGTARCSGMETFDLDTGAFVGRVYDGHQHGDLGVNSDGATEILMTFEMSAPPPNNDFPAIGVRDLPGTATVSEPTYVQVIDWFGDHISCQGPNGVCLVTTIGDAGNGWGALEGELFLQYTDGRVLRLAHHRSTDCGYWVQPRASISSDGRYVVFASDWGQETGFDSCGGGNDLGAGEAYVIDLGRPSLSIPLVSGHNMVSLPLCPEDPSIESVLAGISAKIVAVWAYDAFDSVDPWKSYVPEAVGNDLVEIDCARGYWFELSAGASLTIAGAEHSGAAIPLRAGWNLAGYPSLAESAVGSALGAVIGAVGVAWHYEAPGSSSPWKRYVPGGPAWATDLESMSPGAAYWLLLTEDRQWTLPSSTSGSQAVYVPRVVAPREGS